MSTWTDVDPPDAIERPVHVTPDVGHQSQGPTRRVNFSETGLPPPTQVVAPLNQISRLQG